MLSLQSRAAVMYHGTGGPVGCSAAGCDRRQNSQTLLPHFQRVIEISRGDNVSGSHDSCLDIAGG